MNNASLFPRSVIFLVADLHLGGGGERVVANLSNNLTEKNYKVTILSVGKRKPALPFEFNKKITIEYLGTDLDSSVKWLHKIISLTRLRNYIKKLNEKSIVLGVGNYPSLLLSMNGKSRMVKTIGCQHLAYNGIHHIWAMLRRLFFDNLDAIVVLTEKDKPRYQSLNKQVVTIPNSFSFYPEQTAALVNTQLLTIGRMVPEKGFDKLIQVAGKVIQRCPHWKFKIIGDGPMYHTVREQIAHAGLQSNIEIAPRSENVLNEYLESSIMVMTSKTEGLPMVLIEAQACGLPAVSFDCETGPSDIIVDNRTGFLVEQDDIETMADKIILLIEDNELRKKMGQEAHHRIVKFAPESVLAQWESLFSDLYKTA